MKIEWKNLAAGIWNSISPREAVEQVAAERIAICHTCPSYSPNAKARGEDVKFPYAHCTICSCNMYLKTRAMSAYCPEHKWESQTDDVTSDILLKEEVLKEQLDEYKRDLHAKKINDHGSS